MKRRFTILTAALALLAFLAIPMGMRGQAPVGTTLWGETWTRGDANETPSAYGFEGTTVYGGATLTYAQSSTNTKLYEEALAGGESPELLLSKSNQTWTISNIPTGQATGMALTFKSNKTTFDVTSTTTGITISGSQKSWTIASTSSVTTFNLTIKNTGSSNARIDDIVLSVTTAGGDTPQPTTYTVTYDANGGSGTMTDSDSPYAAGATVTVLGNEFTRTDYEFDHWNTAADDSGTSYDEDDTFTINANTTLYAQWTENTTPTPSGETATLNIQAYAEANEWVSGTKYATATVAPVTFTANGGGNTGKYYSNGQDWRFYQNESASITISVAEGYTLVSVTPTYSVSNGGVLKNGNATIISGTTVNVSGTSVTFTVGNSGSATNGQVRFTNIDVTYVSNGGTIPPSISANNVEIAYDAEEGTINYTINNPVEGGSIVASTEAEWLMVDDEAQTDAEGSIYFYCGANSNFYAHSATVTLTYTYGDSKATVTKDITVTQALDPDANGSTAEYPIMVSEAIDAIDEVGTVSNIYVGGIVSNIETEYSSQYHNITFDMIDEEGNEYFLRAYRCGGDEAADVTVGDEVIVYGNLVKFGEIYEFAQGCEVVSLIHPVVPTIAVSPVLVELDAEEHDGTLDLTYESLTITDMTDFDIQFCDANGDELSEEPDWIEVLVAEQDPEIGEGYVVSYYMVENEGPDARTAYFKVYAMDDETNLVYSNLVTISQAAPVVPPTPSNWVLTDLANLTADDVFVIVGDNGDTYAMPVDGGGQNGAPAAVAVTVVEGTLSAEPAANLQWNISITEDGYTFYPNGETETWLYCTNANNGVRVGTGEAKHFTLDEGYLKTTETTDQRYIGIYNSQDWRCYTNTTGNIVGQTFSFYKKVEPTPAGPSITVNGYGDTEGGYVLLAWPESTSPANIEGMISDDYGAQLTPETPDTYDLYYYDESQEKEWRNYRTNSFNLVPGKGYLYASKAGVTLTYEGVANPEFANVDNLPYTENNLVKSLYLAGNSKTTTETFYVYDGENQITFNYLVMNEDGNGFTSGQTTSFEAQPLQGFFVQAPKANTTLSTTNESDADGVSLLNVQVMRNRGTVVDNAIVSFSNGPTMKKLQLFENSTKLYIPQDNEDYAIVRSEAQGELPVSFRASENGTYTLSMNVENVDMNYLHLIDNMTGMDIDLLQTPSYTFEANTNDYANRFKLVFAANGTDEADESSFAFFSNGNLIVNNEGNATLQVIDINGRILSSETISGSCSKAINATTGVYMLRLINGDNVKVQKVVVR